MELKCTCANNNDDDCVQFDPNCPVHKTPENSHPAFSKDRKVYTTWFLEHYSQEKYKNHLISQFGQKYYDEVMKIHKERIEKNDFEIGPQSFEEWDNLRKSINS